MSLNPYESYSTPDSIQTTEQERFGSNIATCVSVCLMPMFNEASIFWGHTEWIFWHFREMFPLGVKLWTIGMAANLTLFGVLNYARLDTQIPWKMSIAVAWIPVVAYFAMCVVGIRFINYDMYFWLALISLQIACVFSFRSSFAGKILVGSACISGFGIYALHMMIYSLMT